MKKRYSNYFKECMAVAIIALIASIALGIFNYTTLSAASAVLSFVSWYAGLMAPDHEKYKSSGNIEDDLLT